MVNGFVGHSGYCVVGQIVVMGILVEGPTDTSS